jgi:hypothetical protein
MYNLFCAARGAAHVTRKVTRNVQYKSTYTVTRKVQYKSTYTDAEGALTLDAAHVTRKVQYKSTYTVTRKVQYKSTYTDAEGALTLDAAHVTRKLQHKSAYPDAASSYSLYWLTSTKALSLLALLVQTYKHCIS